MLLISTWLATVRSNSVGVHSASVISRGLPKVRQWIVPSFIVAMLSGDTVVRKTLDLFYCFTEARRLLRVEFSHLLHRWVSFLQTPAILPGRRRLRSAVQAPIPTNTGSL